MEQLAPYISPILTAVMAFAGSWLAFSTRLTRVETKIDNLEAKQDKHNNLIERTYKLEGRMEVLEKEVSNGLG